MPGGMQPIFKYVVGIGAPVATNAQPSLQGTMQTAGQSWNILQPLSLLAHLTSQGQICVYDLQLSYSPSPKVLSVYLPTVICKGQPDRCHCEESQHSQPNQLLQWKAKGVILTRHL